MNEAKILTSLEECKKYFKMVNIPIEATAKIKKLAINKYSSKYTDQLFRDKSDYDKLYTTAMENEDFDFHITLDNGIFQFYAEKRNNKISEVHYVFYSNSRNIEPIKELFDEKKSRDENFDAKVYLDLLELAELKDNILYFRYDFDRSLYNEIIHSTSHIHIGYDNEIRIALNKLLTPEAFIDFVIKYAYKGYWQDAIEKQQNFLNRIKELKSECEVLKSHDFTSEENKLLHLT